MKEYSRKNKFTRESIIGLGEDSFRKNYYPELQGKIIDLERINDRNKAIINTIPDIMLISDEKGNISPITTFKDEKSIIVMQLMRNSTLMSLLREKVLEVVDKREMITYEFKETVKEELKYFEARINISSLEEVLIIIRDMTNAKLLEMQLRDIALRDSLTDLFNRRVFEEKLAEINECNGIQVGLLFIDIDGLKFFNDTLGHQTGDLIIKEVAKILLKVFVDIATVSRLSGDEFGVLISKDQENCTLSGIPIINLDDELKRRINEMNRQVRQFSENSDTLKISVSYGYSLHKDGAVNSRLLYKEADNNMYQNKMLKASSVRSGVVKALMKALEARDYITEGHADRMEEMAKQLAVDINLSQNRIDKLQLLAKFHDIGKVGIPDSILNKPGKLSDEEYKVMKTHTQIGKRIAQGAPDLQEIADLIFAHHERWDGLGYPSGLKKEEIPIECRILAIVDTYDAMTNDRPYRRRLSHDTAMTEIINNKNKQFDAILVDKFVAYMKKSSVAN